MNSGQATELIGQAIDLYDRKYCVDDDNPGILFAFGSTEPVSVPVEVWFFLRGARFGIGDYSSREMKAER